MSILYCSTEDHRLNIDEKPVLASGSRNVDYMQVTLDDTWTSLENVTFHANFYMTDENNGYIVNLTQIENNNYQCIIPYRAYTDSGYMLFGVFARNSNSQIVKTSTIRRMRIRQGILTDSDEPPDGYEVLSELILALNTQFNLGIPEDADTTTVITYLSRIQDFNSVKPRIISALNDTFDLELDADATINDIVNTINSLEDGAQVTIFFIDLLNSQLDLQLEYDAEETEIADTVKNKVDEMKQGTIDFSLLQYYVRKISNDYVTNPSEDATPEFLNYTNDIDDYMQISTNALTDLYGGD